MEHISGPINRVMADMSSNRQADPSERTTGYHVTTPRKLERYRQTGGILPPVRFWPNEYTAQQWAKRTGRPLVLKIYVEKSYPLPDHRPARWTDEIVREWEILT